MYTIEDFLILFCAAGMSIGAIITFMAYVFREDVDDDDDDFE